MYIGIFEELPEDAILEICEKAHKRNMEDVLSELYINTHQLYVQETIYDTWSDEYVRREQTWSNKIADTTLKIVIIPIVITIIVPVAFWCAIYDIVQITCHNFFERRRVKE